ncbi:hypothetical protein EYF80_064269 [Liparis tanakae]|uniref:Uncharacterized protein n=1 Tax=Liparis tanakae TaxID=230148 RepID=A0A4Z2EAL1_9TELE|nr:hypothetical protein EYF80_064269 [Liparis tanakae]
MLESLQQSVDELKVKQEAARDLYINLNRFLKEGNPDQTAQQAEQERSEELRLEAALQRQKLLHAGLMETEQQQRRWIHRNAVYRELLVRTVRMTKVLQGRSNITLHYITLHYITLHHITSHYITSHYITSHHII